MATLITSWGGIGDTSYVTLDEAKDYIGSNTIVGYKSDPTIWTNISTVAQARALLAATNDVDNAAHYIGERQFYDQTLEFPRVPAGETQWPWINRALTTANTYNIYLTEQKRRVKQATIEQAYSIVRDGDHDEHLARRLKGISSYSESTGPISESYSYGRTVLSLCPEAMLLIQPYREAGMRLERG